MTYTTEAVLALAPDDASAKAARGLASLKQWPRVGANELAVWGECQGSGSKPYQTQVDLKGPAFKCSCPSRKFPCKHGLALLLMRASDHAPFAANTVAPAWVNEWLNTRSEKAEKKEQKAKAPAQADPAEAAKRAEQRWTRMASASQELQRWLCDQVRRGLGSLGEVQRDEWKTMAARLVDMQVPGLAQRVVEAAELIGRGSSWPERMLQRLGMLQLAVDALARHDTLDDALKSELRSALGWPIDRAEVLDRGEKLRDTWLVVGQLAEERDDRLTERRVWLQGQDSGRRALLLDHAFAGKGFEQSWLTAHANEATLAFFPGRARLRALCVEVHGGPVPLMPRSADLASEWTGVAQRIAASPWTPLHPILLGNAVPRHGGADRSSVAVDGQVLPLRVGDGDGWLLLAHGGGRGVRLMGEWDGEALRPLTAWSEEGVWQRVAAS